MDSLRGQLLIAAPALADPNFARSVVLVAHHDDEGAMGVVLNRPSEQIVSQAVPELAGVVGDDAAVFVGGPVQTNGVMVLAEFDDPADAALPLHGHVGFVALEAEHDAIAEGTRRVRSFAGHAGWGPGQLEGELDADTWIVAPFEPEDAFTEEPDTLWSRALERKGGSYALIARMPLDPSVN